MSGEEHVNDTARKYLDPIIVLNRFCSALESGALNVPASLTRYAMLYQLYGNTTFERVDYSKSVPLFQGDVPAEHAPREEHVLVPLSGGYGSAAALWYALEQGWHVHLLHIVESAPGAERSREAIKELAVSARDREGFPLVESVSEKPRIRLTTVPEVPLDAAADSGRAQEMFAGFAMHPHAALVMHVQATHVAVQRRCGRVLWSGHWSPDERLLASALFEHSQSLTGIQHSFAHDTRADAIDALREAERRAEGLTLGLLRAADCVLCARPLDALAPCNRVARDAFLRRQAELPRVLGGACNNCAECVPWLDLLMDTAPTFEVPPPNKPAESAADDKSKSKSRNASSKAGGGTPKAKAKAKPKAGKSKTKRKRKELANTGDADLDQLLDDFL